MLIFPAIDLYEGCAVRLKKGDYQQKTVYSNNPLDIAFDFKDCGAEHIHIVDLEGAKEGTTPNLELICRIKKESGMFVEVGGGIRTLETAARYIDAGIDRVILGTKAVTDPDFAGEAVARFGKKTAVGVDIKDGYAAVKGWVESSELKAFDLIKQMHDLGVSTIICTDISKDGMLEGPNNRLYEELSETFKDIDFIASGGVTTIEDIEKLKKAGLYGAIIGRAYYEKTIDLKDAVAIGGNKN